MEIFKEIFINNLGKQDPAFAPSGAVERVQLVKVNLSALGFTKPAIYQDIISKAEGFGLELCPLILAAHLRLEYLDQPEGPSLKVASPKVGNSDDAPRGLYLRNKDQALWLRGYRASDDWEYQLEMEFIFQRSARISRL